MPAMVAPHPSQNATYRLTHLLQLIFRQQANELASSIGTLLRTGRDVDLSHWAPAMVAPLRPFLLSQWQTGMAVASRRIVEQLGPEQSHRLAVRNEIKGLAARSIALYFLKGEQRKRAAIQTEFELVNSRVTDAVDQLVLQFCRDTNDTIQGDLNTALAEIREQIREGTSQGAAYRTIAARVHTIVTDPYRASRIATTETVRAMHAGQLMAAVDSGVVSEVTWEASGDACDRCLQLRDKSVPLGEPFIVLPKGGPYAVVYHPPLHPFCMCALKERIGRPSQKVSIPELPPARPAARTITVSSTSPADSHAHALPWEVEPLQERSEVLMPKLKKDKDAKLKGVKLVGSTKELDKEIKEKETAANKISKEIDRLGAQVNALWKATGPLSGEAIKKYKELTKQINSLTGGFFEAREQLKLAKDKLKPADLVDALAAPDPLTVTPDYGGFRPLPDTVRADTDAVCALLSKIVGKSGLGESVLKVGVRATAEPRAYASGGVVFLPPNTNKGIIAHEIGHCIEFLYPKATEALRAFWHARCAKEKPINLKAKFPGSGYEVDEVGYEDDFGKAFGGDKHKAAYTGKIYPNGQTEILSMGLEMLFRSPSDLAQRDPEWFALIVGILRGDYR